MQQEPRAPVKRSQLIPSHISDADVSSHWVRRPRRPGEGHAMRRATALAAAALFVLCSQVSPAGAATSGDQNWTVITEPGQPTRVVASGVLNAAGTVVDHLTL